MASANSASQAHSWASASKPTVVRQAPLSRAPIGRPREQLVAIDEVQERHRLPLERVDDVPVVDDVATPPTGLGRPAAAQREHRGGAEEGP